MIYQYIWAPWTYHVESFAILKTFGTKQDFTDLFSFLIYFCLAIDELSEEHYYVFLVVVVQRLNGIYFVN